MTGVCFFFFGNFLPHRGITRRGLPLRWRSLWSPPPIPRLVLEPVLVLVLARLLLPPPPPPPPPMQPMLLLLLPPVLVLKRLLLLVLVLVLQV